MPCGESLKQSIKSIVKQNDCVQKFIALAGSSALYFSNPEIIENGLVHLFEQMINEEETASILKIMEMHSTDCSTPVANLCMFQHIAYLQQNNHEIPEGLILKAALYE